MVETTVEQLITALHSRGVKLWIEDDQLRSRSPKGAITPALRDQVRDHKAAIIEFLRQAQDDVPQPSIHPVPRTGALPLSYAQQRLWLLDQLGTGAAYNIPLALKLAGRLDTAALQQTLTKIVRRHESLRTTFALIGDAGCQIIGASRPVSLDFIDLQQLPPDAQEAELKRLAAEEALEPFDLSQDLMLRAKLLQLATEQYVLLLTMHHSASDGWSLGILVQEIATLYKSFIQGQPASLPELPIQYADFAVWQRDWLQGEVLEKQLAYWQDQLADAPQLLQLPTDRPRPPIQTFRGSLVRFRIGTELTRQLQQLSRQSDTTLFMTLLAAFQILLMRYSGQEDIVVGSPIANRNRKEIEPLIGFFVNTLVLRTDLSGNPTFLELLAQVRRVTQTAYDHQDLPFERLVEALQPDRNLNHSPLVQVAFALQNAPLGAFELPGLRVSPLETDVYSARLDLELHLWEEADELDGYCIYNPDLFEATTIDRMMGHFQMLLSGIVANPQQRIMDLPLLTEAERHKILVEWNDTRADYPKDKCLHQLFEAQVERTPEAVAVVYDDKQLTYRELNGRANQLAHYLISLGVGPESLVGICVERSLEMVIGIYGIVKAGGAYVPLDPTYPSERLRFMLDDAQVSILLTQHHLLNALPDHQARVICLDTDWSLIATEKPDNPNSGVRSNNLAYMIYTSGSTGQPKGALNAHEGIVNRIVWMQHAYTLTAADRILQKTPFSFDVSVWEFFWPLLFGARLVIARPDGHKDPSYLQSIIEAEQITTLHFVPSMLQIFMEIIEPHRCPSLRRVICSGEALPWVVQQRFFQHFTAELYNLYGPTEAAVDVTHWHCHADRGSEVVPIGHPLSNLKIHILDQRLHPVPIGVAGEIYIGGIGVGRGYHQRPALTAEKFITHPFPDQVGEKPDARLYKTGDLGRYQPDGSIVFLGRVDHQVKIRGFRVELGEIEAALVQHPAIQAATVVTRETKPGDQRLVAYVVPNQQNARPVWQMLRLENEGLLADRLHYALPNGMDIICLNQLETEFVYGEVFEEQSYLKYGITLDEGACIFDVGAHIGMFTLFTSYACKNATVYAFEPIPPIFDVLQLNTLLYNIDVKLFNCGLASEAGQASFNYYPHISVLSGRYADPQDEYETVKMFLSNQPHSATSQMIDELLEIRGITEPFTCQMKTISQVIRENDVEIIDLLKIDVEKSELDVLNGINQQDWSKIRQLVVEVHDIDNRLKQTIDLLESNGYQVTVEQNRVLSDTGLYNIFGLRPRQGQSAPRRRDKAQSADKSEQYWSSSKQLVDEVRQLLQKQLPDFMLPSAFVMLDTLPLTPNGKIDRKALPAPERRVGPAYAPPHTPIQESLVAIWTEVLGSEPIGIHDDFFELGGHSLLATQLMSRLSQTFQITVPLRQIFEAPTIAGLANYINERLSDVDAEAALVELPTVIPAPEQRYHPFPLTDIQHAYWLGRSDAFELGNVSTHGYMEFESRSLDVPRLNAAWQMLIERHAMLRMVVLPDGQQQILEEVPAYQISMLDLTGVAEAEQTARLTAIRQEMSHEILPADQWPLFNIRATRLDARRVRLHISLDGLIADAWSLFTLFKEWALLYHNPDYPLPTLTLSFRDYILAERKLAETALYEQAEAYWFDRLDTLPPAPELPLAQNPAQIAQPHFKRRTMNLDKASWQALKQRATQAGLTPTGVLLTAFASVLAAWSKQPRFTLNLTLFNRLPLHPQVNDIVGDFTSLTMLEVDHSEAMPFTERVRRLQQQLWRDLDHRYMSGVRVQRELARRRGGPQNALMPVVFTGALAFDASRQDSALTDDFGKMVYSIGQTPQVWLDHQVVEQAGALAYNWDTVEQLFPAGMVEVMFETYGTLLQQLADDEAAWEVTRQIPLPARQLAQRAEVNTTAAPVSDAMLHTLFLEQVESNPNATAVISPELTLTYRQLYRRANHVGHRLRQHGAQPNSLVAVVMNKGWEQIVAVLGIHLAGAAYLPIDPDLPDERRCYLLDQGEVDLVLTQSWLDETLTWPPAVRRLGVDTLVTDDSLPPLAIVQQPTDLAYVIYTSGSTGLPKGVMIDHRGAVNTILDLNDRFAIGPGDRVLALSNLNFDLSVYDIFGTLATGGAIVMPVAELRIDPAHWRDLMRDHQVTLWNSVPALMQMLIDYLGSRADRSGLESLRLVWLSGDWIPVTLPEQIRAVWPEVQLISMGGATEASIWSILYPIEAVDPTWSSIPYGKPMRNQSWQVLNERLEPCPIWVPGELYIGGIGLAQGYWRDDEKTDARFITHPDTGERMYKTGDLGRYLPDGNIEFLGREDFQVKIRGHRIELGEIEAALLQHSHIKEAVVTAVGEPRGHRQLVAYVVPQVDTGPADIILDPLERLEFKLSQPGLRRSEPAETSIDLPTASFDESITHRYLARQSYRHFQADPIDLETLSRFLSCLRQMPVADAPLPKYRYPSAGSLYPVQTYLYLKPDQIESISGGFYYYHPGQHRLVLLDDKTPLVGRNYDQNQPIFESAAFALFQVGHLDAIEPMYGDRARDFCLLEAGYIGQLLMEEAPAHELGLCPIGWLDFEALPEIMGLSANHILLQSFLGGKIAPAQMTQWNMDEPTQGKNNAVEQLESYLQQKLPAYMVPTTYILLETLPLTPNGKVDRQALPAPETRIAEMALVMPRTDIEQTLATMVQGVLEIDQVGIHHNFFDLGADSVHLVRLRNKLQEMWSGDIPMVALFNHPTISDLAQYLSEQPRMKKPEEPTLSATANQQISDRAAKQREFLKRQQAMRTERMQSRDD